MQSDTEYMQLALEQARLAIDCDEVPVGAVIVDSQGSILGCGHNAPITKVDPTAHAEIRAIRSATAHIGNYRLAAGCTMFVTLEPCVMCVGALWQARIGRLVIAADQPKMGAVYSSLNLLDRAAEFSMPKIAWEKGLLREQALQLIQSFFAQKR